jgi:outer membrane protein assembly factor BamA
MLLLMLTLVLGPQQEPSGELTRTEQLRLAREEKAQHLQAPRRSFLEKGLYEFKERRVMERFQAGFMGFHPMLGSMRKGSGFAFGASYDVKDGLKASAQASLKGYQKYEVLFTAPHLMNDRAFAEVRSTYRSNPQETFFGMGNDTRSEDRANYRLEDRSVAGKIGVRVREHVNAGVQLGWIDTNVGGGTSSRWNSIEEAFDTTELPGFESQPTYLQSGVFVDVDYRDEPGNPRAGGRYVAKWSSFHDQNLGQYDFTQYDVEVQQYIPFFHRRRVIALRARTTLMGTAEGQKIPFYMLPTLGGSDDLRGFADFRFRDRNLVVVNAEYRWEAFSGLDLALFADAGEVAASTRELNLRDMKTAAGIGFRFNTAKKVFYRVDVGFSREGTRVFMNFGHVF